MAGLLHSRDARKAFEQAELPDRGGQPGFAKLLQVCGGQTSNTDCLRPPIRTDAGFLPMQKPLPIFRIQNLFLNTKQRSTS